MPSDQSHLCKLLPTALESSPSQEWAAGTPEDLGPKYASWSCMLSQGHCPYHYLASHLLCCYLHTGSLLAYESKHLAFCQLPPIPTPRGSGECLSSTSSDLSRFILEHTCPSWLLQGRIPLLGRIRRGRNPFTGPERAQLLPFPLLGMQETATTGLN